MPDLTGVRDAALALLARRLPGVRVEAFAGHLDMRSASSRHIRPERSGAIFVAAGEAENAAAPHSLDFDMAALFWAFAVARHAAGDDAAEGRALLLAQEAALALHGQTFGLAGVSPARVLSLSPADGDDLARAGIRVWAVTWEQRVLFGDAGGAA